MLKTHPDRIRRAAIDSTLFSAVAALTGALCAYGALGFLYLLHFVERLFFYGSGTDARAADHVGIGYSALGQLPWWHLVLAPTLGGLLVGLAVQYGVRGQRSYGPADVLAAVHRHDGEMSLRIGLQSALTSALSIGAGASAGRYGPAVHLGASLSAWVGNRLKLGRSQRVTLLSCGVAAAIAASFNAPLAGVVFAYEFLLGQHVVRTFVPVTIAAVIGTTISRTQLGNFSIFATSSLEIGHSYEFVLFVGLGLLGGGLAIAFVRAIERTTQWVGASALPLWARPMIGGLLLGMLGATHPQVLSLGEEAINAALHRVFPLELLLALVGLKLLATVVSLGFGFSGGVFGPALFLGAMLGGAAGELLGLLVPGLSSPSIYAVAGMGAVISCIIGAPLTTIIVVFELTSSYPVTTAVMIAVVAANLITGRFMPGSFFHLQLAQRGIDVSGGREEALLRQQTAASVMSREYTGVGADMPISEVLERLVHAGATAAFVVGDHGRLLGTAPMAACIGAQRAGAGAAPASEIAVPPSRLVTGAEDLHGLIATLEEGTEATIPVVEDRETLCLVGVIRHEAMLRAQRQAVATARREGRGEV